MSSTQLLEKTITSPPIASKPPVRTSPAPLERPLGMRVENDLEDLGNQIVTLSANITAATYRLLVMIAEFDARSGWAGWRSCAHWLNWRIGLGMGAAREKVRVARRLAELPLLARAMERGEVSFSKVRAITRVAAPETERDLVELARHTTASQLERVCRSWRRVSRRMENQHDALRRASRGFSSSWDEDGMLVVRGRLEPEVGAVFLKALEAAGDDLFEAEREKERREETIEAFEQRVERMEPKQRRADALGLLAERSLRAGSENPQRAESLRVVVHVDEPVLAMAPPDSSQLDAGDADAGVPETVAQAFIEHGPGVSAETSRRMACDASLVEMVHGSDGSVLDVGRSRRTIPPAIRRALQHRDQGCRFPGCDSKFCEAHHIEHWADGGETRLDNLVLLCRFHHRALHEGGFSVERTAEGVAFFRPGGCLVPEVGPPLVVDETAPGRLCRDNLRQGLRLGRYTMPLWNGDRLDLGVAIDGLVRRVERARRKPPL